MVDGPPANRPRLLVFVIAYYAEDTLKSVLERIPRTIFEEYDCRILVVDDASEDRTSEIGRRYQQAHPEIRMTVLRNQYNQGYGGNQKVGYAFAIRERFDFVALLHGDAQYAPEELPALVRPLAAGQADAVFGSRMLTRGGALKGGMPLYKFVGNRTLTIIQNLLLRTRFSEFHSGYRVYSAAALKKIPFHLNSNQFHFDTEIIIQLLNAGQRILELPIPTYYGGEISRVNGIKYAKDVIVVTLQNVAHRSGILYQRRFDPATGDVNVHYDLKLGYPSSHQFALDAVPPGARVLDLGAGPGGFARELVRKGCTVTVVDRAFDVSARDPNVTCLRQDLDDEPAYRVCEYDFLLLLDVIEHVKDPERLIERIRAQFDYSPPTLVLTTPNIAFVVQRVMLMLGQFNYGKAGILDRTHARLFTFRSFRRLLTDAGFRIREMRGVPAPFPKVLGAGALGRAAVAVNQLLIRVSKTLFSYQIFVVAEGTPSVDFVLQDATRRSARGSSQRGRATTSIAPDA
jgi:glycosyltransferase involved in cell wall biosynthesis